MNQPTYEVITDDNHNTIIKRIDADGTIWWIPTDVNNSDYQAYLAAKDEAKTK